MASTASGKGYWLVASDGGLFSFGDAGFFGSTAGTGRTVMGMVPSPTGSGYYQATDAGEVIGFGDAYLSAPAGKLNQKIVGLAAGHRPAALPAPSVPVQPNVIVEEPTTTTTAPHLLTPAEKGRPNILVIVTDDQRADGTLEGMPLTRKWFQEEGTTFVDGYANTPLCCPERGTIFSGRYMHNHGVVNNGEARNLDKKWTMPRYLQEAGYSTALVGKYLDGWNEHTAPPNFDRFAITGGGYVDEYFNVDGVGDNAPYSTDFVGERSLQILGDFEAADDARPWYLHVTPHAPHDSTDGTFSWPERHNDVPIPPYVPSPAALDADRDDQVEYIRHTRRVGGDVPLQPRRAAAHPAGRRRDGRRRLPPAGRHRRARQHPGRLHLRQRLQLGRARGDQQGPALPGVGPGALPGALARHLPRRRRRSPPGRRGRPPPHLPRRQRHGAARARLPPRRPVLPARAPGAGRHPPRIRRRPPVDPTRGPPFATGPGSTSSTTWRTPTRCSSVSTTTWSPTPGSSTNLLADADPANDPDVAALAADLATARHCAGVHPHRGVHSRDPVERGRNPDPTRVKSIPDNWARCRAAKPPEDGPVSSFAFAPRASRARRRPLLLLLAATLMAGLLPVLSDAAVSGAATPAAGQGVWLVAQDGGIFSHGDAAFFGSTGSVKLNQPVVGMAGTPSMKGYWMVAADGGIFSFGDAGFYGSTGSMKLNKPIVGMASTPSGKGYWLVATDGGIFSFGDAGFYGSTGAMKLNKPIVGMASTPSGKGYWMVATDGGIFSFGDAAFYGSTGALALVKPIVGMASTASSKGYWLVASDGGLFSFGDAKFYGSSAGTNRTVVGMVPSPTGLGYYQATDTGEVIGFGDAYLVRPGRQAQPEDDRPGRRPQARRHRRNPTADHREPHRPDHSDHHHAHHRPGHRRPPHPGPEGGPERQAQRDGHPHGRHAGRGPHGQPDGPAQDEAVAGERREHLLRGLRHHAAVLPGAGHGLDRSTAPQPRRGRQLRRDPPQQGLDLAPLHEATPATAPPSSASSSPTGT